MDARDWVLVQRSRREKLKANLESVHLGTGRFVIWNESRTSPITISILQTIVNAICFLDRFGDSRRMTIRPAKSANKKVTVSTNPHKPISQKNSNQPIFTSRTNAGSRDKKNATMNAPIAICRVGCHLPVRIRRIMSPRKLTMTNEKAKGTAKSNAGTNARTWPLAVREVISP